MSDDTELYRVLYLMGGQEMLTDPESKDAAEATARRLAAEGITVGSVMTSTAADAYVQDKYGTEYRGVTIPDGLREDWPRSVFEAWKRGVDSALDATRKPAGDDDFRWIVRVHWSAEHTSPDVGPFGLSEANAVMRAMRRRFREAGLKPPRITRELLRSPGALDGWITDRIDEAKADDPLRGPACTDPGCPAGYPHHGPCPGEENR